MGDPAEKNDPLNDPQVKQFKEGLEEIFEEHEARLEQVEEGLNDCFARMEEVEEVTARSVRRIEDSAEAFNRALPKVPRTTKEKVLYELKAVARTTGRVAIGVASVGLPIVLAVLLIRRKR